MGVLPCNRSNCGNVMCDRYSYTYGYICNDCFEELVRKRISIRDFMNSDKEVNDSFEYSRQKTLEEEFEIR